MYESFLSSVSLLEHLNVRFYSYIDGDDGYGDEKNTDDIGNSKKSFLFVHIYTTHVCRCGILLFVEGKAHKWKIYLLKAHNLKAAASCQIDLKCLHFLPVTCSEQSSLVRFLQVG